MKNKNAAATTKLLDWTPTIMRVALFCGVCYLAYSVYIGQPTANALGILLAIGFVALTLWVWAISDTQEFLFQTISQLTRDRVKK